MSPEAHSCAARCVPGGAAGTMSTAGRWVGCTPGTVHHPPGGGGVLYQGTPTHHPAVLRVPASPPGTPRDAQEWASGLNSLAGRAPYREYRGTHGNTREYREYRDTPRIREYTGIPGIPGIQEYTGTPGIHGNHGNTREYTGTPGTHVLTALRALITVLLGQRPYGP